MLKMGPHFQRCRDITSLMSTNNFFTQGHSRLYPQLKFLPPSCQMKHPERVVELTTSEQERLLKELDNPDTFQRKMIAHNILRQLHWFLIDGKRAIVRKEMQMERRKGHNN